MLATLRQQLAARLLAQVLQHVQLLVESFGSATDAGFLDLAQPLGSITGIVDVPAGTGDRPAAIDRFQPTHDSGQIFDDGQVATVNATGMVMASGVGKATIIAT